MLRLVSSINLLKNTSVSRAAIPYRFGIGAERASTGLEKAGHRWVARLLNSRFLSFHAFSA